MLCIEVELLAGRYAATAYNDRSRAEWPPHPARFFSALVAALHDTAPPDEAERAALAWLELQRAPALAVDIESVSDELGRREVRDVFVPVNDITVVAALEPKLRAAALAVEEVRAAIAAKRDLLSTKALAKELAKLNKDLEKASGQLAKLQAGLNETGSAAASELKAARALLPDHRTRQMRTFPVVFPSDRRFHFVWSGDPPAAERAALDRLCDRVTRLGHSSSLVRCSVVDREPTPNLVPDAGGEYVLRTVGPGQLSRLEQQFERHQGVLARVLPARPERYGSVGRAPKPRAYPQSLFSEDWIVFERIDHVFDERCGQRLTCSRPLSSRAADLAQALRRALLEVHGSRDLPAALSGHTDTGAAANAPHVAFVALPHVAHEHADASVKGLAVVLPRSLSRAERTVLFELIATWERTRSVDADHSVMELGGHSWSGFFVRRTEQPRLRALSPATWCRPASRFVTATPIALDRYPGNLRSNVERTAHIAAQEAELSIAAACARIGLPTPQSVDISFAPLLAGGQAARAFRPQVHRPDRPPRVRLHADIRFGEPVRGPVLLGAGRYLGLGLCVPVGG